MVPRLQSDSGGPSNRPGDPINGVLILERAVLATTLGIVGGLVLFVATLWLVVKGGPRVGPHLELLNQFFYGYAVTVRGSFIGFVYGFGCGFVSGWIIATVYNWVVSLRQRSSN
jgi:hypothetical protein